MWDCKYKVGRDGCRLRKVGCYPGGKKCVLRGKFSFPFREEPDPLEAVPEKARKKRTKR